MKTYRVYKKIKKDKVLCMGNCEVEEGSLKIGGYLCCDENNKTGVRCIIRQISDEAIVVEDDDSG